MTKVKRLTAQEDLTYRIGWSFPKEGFVLKAGQSILITQEGYDLLTTKKLGAHQPGKFMLKGI